jgi:hypothetical protein
MQGLRGLFTPADLRGLHGDVCALDTRAGHAAAGDHLASITIDGGRVVGTPANISQNADYDNQPSFVADGSAILFSSKRDGTQNEIYRYAMASKAVEQVTKTSESEYSPLVTPDRKSFSTVRVEADGSQRLWRFDLDGSNPRLVLERVNPVGYHVWIDATHLGLFVLGAQQGDPSTLQIADTVSGNAQVAATAIARSLLVRPGTATISFIATPRAEPRLVKTIHPQTRAVETVGPALDGSHDAVWWPDGVRQVRAASSGADAARPQDQLMRALGGGKLRSDHEDGT